MSRSGSSNLTSLLQVPILKELDHVPEQTYLPKSTVEKFLSSLAVNEKLTGGDPASYWETVELLDIQEGGDSQSDMLEMFGEALNSKCGLSLADCSGSSPATFIYLQRRHLARQIESWQTSRLGFSQKHRMRLC